jgi:hypothetical protein
MVSQLAFLLGLLIVLLLVLVVYRRQRAHHLRPIVALDELPGQTGRATESGQTLHLSLGTGGIAGNDTVTSLAGVAALAHLAEQGVAAGTPPLVTVSDPTLLPLAQNALRQAYVRRGQDEDFRWTQVRMVAPSPMAYALGTMDIVRHESVLANLMFGAFGPEVGLISAAGVGTNMVQIGGTDDPQALSILYSSADRVVVGEELFATGVYLDRTAARVASLVTEDVARIALVAFAVLYALLRLVGAV